MKKDDIILITGANGFVASWVVYEALKMGCKVRGTVRNPNDVTKVKHLWALPGAKERLELIHLDFFNADESQYTKAVQGVTHIAHTASPFPAAHPNEEDELIVPAVRGTTGVIKAALKERSIKSVVITSSVVAVGEGSSIVGQEPRVRGENDWVDPSKTYPYAKSKVLAERAAWDLWNENGKPWALSTINPGYVQGPMLSNSVATASVLVMRMLKGEVPLAPHLAFGIVDVRNVAEAHIKALSLPTSTVSGRRFILSNETIWMIDMARILQSKFSEMGYSFPKFQAPNVLIWLASWFDKTSAAIYPALDTFPEFDHSPSVDVLGINYIPTSISLEDLAHSLIYHGIVPKQSKYHPPSGDWTPLNA
jgi:nucleoside-diphosphate-sugar epimerase